MLITSAWHAGLESKKVRSDPNPITDEQETADTDSGLLGAGPETF